VVVLACTHYPLVIDEMKLVAPWEVNYLDPAPAIARRVGDVVAELKLAGPQSGVPEPDTVLLTSARGSASESLAAYGAMGFPRHEFVDLPV
jgi:glutamate racemase